VRVDCSCGRGSVEDYYMALSSLYKICEREGASLVYGESTLLGMVYDTCGFQNLSLIWLTSSVCVGHIFALLARAHVAFWG